MLQEVGEALPQNTDVGDSNPVTVSLPVSHGIEVAVEFKPVAHPVEPLTRDQPVKCPLPEPSILNVRLLSTDFMLRHGGCSFLSFVGRMIVVYYNGQMDCLEFDSFFFSRKEVNYKLKALCLTKDCVLFLFSIRLLRYPPKFKYLHIYWHQLSVLVQNYYLLPFFKWLIDA